MAIDTKITAGNMTTATFEARDVASGIAHIGEPAETPLTTLMGGLSYAKGGNTPENVPGKVGKEESVARKVEVFERSPLSRTGTVASAVADTTTTTVVLSSNANIRVNDVLVNTSQGPFGETMLVYAVDAGGANISVRRNLGGTSFTIAADDVLKVSSSAWAENTDKTTVKTQLLAGRYSILQINKRAFRISGTALAMDVIATDVNLRSEEQYVATVEFKKDIEAAAWFNPSLASSTDASANTVYLASGILQTINGFASGSTARYVEYDGAAPSEEFFFTNFAEKAFEFGNQTKAMFTDSRGKSILRNMYKTYQNVEQKTDKFGFQVMTIETNHGVLEVYSNGSFNQYLPETMKGFFCVLDLPYLKYRYLKGRDMKIMDGIQTPGGDYLESQYQAEFGWLLKNIQHHTIMYRKQ